jgi:hypothetical protein
LYSTRTFHKTFEVFGTISRARGRARRIQVCARARIVDRNTREEEDDDEEEDDEDDASRCERVISCERGS